MRRITVYALISVIIVVIGLIVWLVTLPGEDKPYTEFYILGADGIASDYPEEIGIGETGHVIAGVVNHEEQTVDYRITVTLNETEIGGTDDFSLNDGQTRQMEIGFVPGEAGEQQVVTFTLSSSVDNTEPKVLYLRLNIVP